MPVDERQRPRLDHQVRFSARIGVAHLGVAVLDQQPEPPIARTLVGEGEGDDHPVSGQRRSVELHLAPGPQHETGIGTVRGDLHPVLAPRREPVDAGQAGGRLGQPIEVATAGGFRSGLDDAEVNFGDTVVIQGAGPVGLCAAVLAQLRGAGQVIVIGGPDIRLKAANRFGVAKTVDIGSTAAAERLSVVRELTGGRGADVTIEATGVPAAVPEGMRLTRDAGRYVVVGQYTNVGEATFNPHLDLNQKHLEIRGCWGSDVGHMYRSVQVMAKFAKQFPWTQLISGEYDLAHTQQALDDVAAQRVVKALIVP